MTYWQDIARQWSRIGPPLRPAGEDLAHFSGTIEAWSRRHGPPRALILGVTPEFYRIPWPARTRLLAVDHTLAMIEAVWPGPRTTALCAAWTDLPLENDSCDIVLCDGGLHLLTSPQGQRALVRTLGRVIAPAGLCVLRLFTPPRQRESPERVLADLRAGRIANLNLLKFRLWMALQRDSEHGVELARVWEAVHHLESCEPALATRLAWDDEHLRAIDHYRGSAARYHFVGQSRVRDMFCEAPGGFTLESSFHPSYEMGEQCPILVLRRLASAD